MRSAHSAEEQSPLGGHNRSAFGDVFLTTPSKTSQQENGDSSGIESYHGVPSIVVLPSERVKPSRKGFGDTLRNPQEISHGSLVACPRNSPVWALPSSRECVSAAPGSQGARATSGLLRNRRVEAQGGGDDADSCTESQASSYDCPSESNVLTFRMAGVLRSSPLASLSG